MEREELLSFLRKAGLSEEVIEGFKKAGIDLLAEVRERKEFFKSHSPQWFVEIADKYTPPLEEEEREKILENPSYLTEKLVFGAAALRIVSSIIASILERNESIEKDVLLALNRALHSVLDNLVLKYDRLLEYCEHRESPVGFYFNKLKELCRKYSINLHEVLEINLRPLASCGFPRKVEERLRRLLSILERVDESDREEFLRCFLALNEFAYAQELEAKIAGNFMEVFGRYSSVDEMLKELRKLSAGK